MRRRRQKNTLLPKMIGIAVVINAILLPILARMGVFKNVGGQKLTPVELVKLPPPEKKPPPPKKTAKKAVRPHQAGHKAAARPATARHAPSGPPPVKVVAAGPASGTSSGGDSGITGSDNAASPPAPAAVPAPLVTPPPPAPAPPPPPAPPAPAPPPAPTTAAPLPVLTAAAPLAEPQPSLPNDLSFDDIHGSFFALFTIHADGSTEVNMVTSTGNQEADKIALETARRWKFRPATLNGRPVESYQRLEVEFYAA